MKYIDEYRNPKLARSILNENEGTSRCCAFEVSDLDGNPRCSHFDFPGSQHSKSLHDSHGYPVGTLSRIQHQVKGTITCSAERIRDNVLRLSIDVVNETVLAHDPADRHQALLRSLGSAHTILSVSNAEFVSLLEPPEEFRDLASACKQRGNFPVLVGDTTERDMLLCSPILLYDYPQIAPESAGDFFDATEMDEMLTLRVMTLTDEEKATMLLGDEHARNLLQRTEETAREQLMRTHGTIRSLRPSGADHD